MNSIKRQLSFTEATNDVIKKHRKITCFEDLSNELFYEIFDYLDGFNIHKSFSKLNIRFENLLTNSLFPMKIKLSSVSRVVLDDRCRQVIIPNKHRIISLHLQDNSLINDFFKSCFIDSSFSRLESVILRQVSMDTTLMVLFYLNSLPHLSSLEIYFEKLKSFNKLDILYQYIFCLPHLKYNKVSLENMRTTELVLPMYINKKPSNIVHLHINFYCNINQLVSILLHTPYLEHLICIGVWPSDEINRNFEQLKLSHLTRICLNYCSLEFDEFQTFIRKISCQLRKFVLKTRTPGYFHADQWEQLINNYIPYLSHFYLQYQTFNTENLGLDHQSINGFISTFWLEKLWLFELTYDHIETKYCICSYRKKPFYLYANDSYWHSPNSNNDTNLFNYLTNFTFPIMPPIQLIINISMSLTKKQSFFERLKSCYSAVKFTYLSLNCGTVFLDELIQTLRLIPNLDALEVSSLSVLYSNDLSSKDSQTFSSPSIVTKITKLKLNALDNIEHIDILMELCPQMEYLEFNCKTEKDLEMIMRYIIKKSNTHTSNLKCLFIYIPNAHNKIIENLQVMIDFEKRSSINQTFNNYTLRRLENFIFLFRQLS